MALVLNDLDYELIYRSNNPAILNGIVNKGPDASYLYAYFLVDNNLKVPEIIIKSIAINSYEAYCYARFLVVEVPEINDIEVPEIIVNSIARSANLSSLYAAFLNDVNLPVPVIISKAIKNYHH